MPVQTPNTETQDQYAPTAWGGSAYDDLITPSGQKCLVRKPGVESLLKSGILHNTDMLSKIVQTEHVDRVKDKPKSKAQEDAESSAAIMDLMKDEKNVVELVHTIDKIVVYTVIKPTVVMTPDDVTNRKDGVIYADMIELGDRIFIMNYAVGGQTDVEKFREESGLYVGSLGHESEDGAATE